MAHFRGSVQGSRSEASRRGTKRSGIETVAQAWGGEVVVKLWHETLGGEPRDMVRIYARANSATYSDHSKTVPVFYGTLSELMQKIA